MPPPNIPADVFNAENRDLERLGNLGLLRTKRAPTTRVPFKADTYIPQAGEQGAATALSKTRQSARAKALDRNFFASGSMVGLPAVRGVAGEKNGDSFSRVKMFPHQQNAITNTGEAVRAPKGKKKLRGEAKKAALAVAGADPNDKKHFKVKREKKRSGRGYDD
jgi:large subunit GTPase 1